MSTALVGHLVAINPYYVSCVSTAFEGLWVVYGNYNFVMMQDDITMTFQGKPLHNYP